ncbi:unnamed protein product [Pedinophyceae sp. YPF-701]|nr:unnamed protein product [Pedinophyceae sp. YPF-701]
MVAVNGVLRDKSWKYATRTPLSLPGRAAVALLSAAGALMDPKRADLVAALGETSGGDSFRRMRDRMLASSTGRQILEDRPRITKEFMERAAQLPPNTLGGAYASFMGRRGFDPDERAPVRFIDDDELAYVVQRAREVHDLWHVMFECPTTVLGELQLKALEFVQTGMPMCALSVLGAQTRLRASDRQLLWSTYVPWAVRAGTRSRDLMCIYYENHLEDDLQEFRARFRIEPAPRRPDARPGW